MTEGGKFICDRCGEDCGNGGVIDSLVVSDIDPDNPGHVRNLHFCRARENDGKTVKGCDSKVLSNSNLKFYKEHRDATE